MRSFSFAEFPPSLWAIRPWAHTCHELPRCVPRRIPRRGLRGLPLLPSPGHQAEVDESRSRTLLEVSNQVVGEPQTPQRQTQWLVRDR